MFYFLLKRYARAALRIYCVRIVINKPEVLKNQGPLLIAANHPNSFLDGIILSTLFDAPVHSLARGDAFRNKAIARILRKIKLLPIYRSSEGTENLGHNYTTFDACQETFKEKGVVVIFSEGWSENEWHLRPLKKGTARLAITSWQKGIPLTVLPAGINYSSFKSFGKEVHLFFGTPIDAAAVLEHHKHGQLLNAFNAQLKSQLEELVYEIAPSDKAIVHKRFPLKKGSMFYLLLLPAFAGWWLHAPLFYFCKLITVARFRHSDHYDSVLHALLILLYPVYLLFLAIAGVKFFALYGLLVLLLAPFTAYSLTRMKYSVKG